MIIYVQSRGKSQDQDYRWLRIKSNEYYPENPDFLLQPINGLAVRPIDLIESQKPSIVLVATQNDYCLLVTGLKAREERKDYVPRLIRNSVLWICRKDNENLKIRSLLILALREELDRVIDKTINISGQYGFEVNYKALKELSNSTLAIGNNEPIDSCKIGKNYDSLREEIALELESNALPNREGLLVLVTSIKSASAIEKTGVWRGLSNRVEFEKLEKYGSLSTNQSGTEKKTPWIWVAIASILITAIAFLIIKTNTPPKLEPEVIPTPSTIQKNSPTTSKEELNPSVNLTKVKEISYLISSHIFPEEYWI